MNEYIATFEIDNEIEEKSIFSNDIKKANYDALHLAKSCGYSLISIKENEDE